MLKENVKTTQTHNTTKEMKIRKEVKNLKKYTRSAHLQRLPSANKSKKDGEILEEIPQSTSVEFTNKTKYPFVNNTPNSRCRRRSIAIDNKRQHSTEKTAAELSKL